MLPVRTRKSRTVARCSAAPACHRQVKCQNAAGGCHLRCTAEWDSWSHRAPAAEPLRNAQCRPSILHPNARGGVPRTFSMFPASRQRWLRPNALFLFPRAFHIDTAAKQSPPLTAWHAATPTAQLGRYLTRPAGPLTPEAVAHVLDHRRSGSRLDPTDIWRWA